MKEEKVEDTLVVVKLDGIWKNLVSEIKAACLYGGMSIVREWKGRVVSVDFWRTFYAQKAGTKGSDDLLSLMVSGEVLFLHLRGKNALKAARQLSRVLKRKEHARLNIHCSRNAALSGHERRMLDDFFPRLNQKRVP